MTTASTERDTAVAALIGPTKAILADDGLSRPALAKILDGLVNLAARHELWSGADFPAPENGERHARYLVYQDADQSHALYLNVMLPGNLIIPHNHTTWACIAAVEGIEHNHLFRRTDDGTQPGRAALVEDRTIEVGPGTGIALLPDDIHAVEIRGSRPIRHLHLYGRALETLSERIRFDVAAGTCEPMPIGVRTRAAS